MASSQPRTFGALLRRYRVAAGLTQEELAERAGLSRRAIGALETGERLTPHQETVTLLAEALGLTAAERALLESVAHHRLPGAMFHTDPAAGLPAQMPRLRPTGAPLAGRRQEMRALEQHLSTGDGSPLLALAGEAGIGKSRLLQECVRLATEQGRTTLAGGCHRRSGQEPYAPFVAALTHFLATRSAAQQRRDLEGCAWLVRLLPELADHVISPAPSWTLPPEQERRLLFGAIGTFLSNVASPVGTLLVLDDLHWAGSDTLDLLAALSREPRPLPLRIVVAYRDTDVAARDTLPLLLSDLTREGLATRIGIATLERDDAKELLINLLAGESEPARENESQTAVIDTVLDRASGLPFFLVSWAQELRTTELSPDAAHTTIPWSAAESIRQRVAILPEAAFHLLAIAAVAGHQVTRKVLLTAAKASGQREADTLAMLDLICHTRLLSETADGSYIFPHDLIRETVAAGLSGARRAALHRLVATALESQPQREQQATELAWHFAEGDEPARALPYALLAGDQAAAVFAHTEAEQHYWNAAEVAQAMGEVAVEAEAREKLGRTLHYQARFEQAVPELERAAALALAVGDYERRWRAMALIARAYDALGLAERCIAELQLAIAETDTMAASGVTSPHALAYLFIELAGVSFQSGRYTVAFPAAEQAVVLAERVGDAHLLVTAWGRLGLAHIGVGNRAEAERTLLEAVRLGEEAGQLAAAYHSLVNLADIYLSRGEFSRAGRFLQQAIDIDERTDNLPEAVFAITCLVELAYFQGDWAAAEEACTRAERLFKRTGQKFDARYVLLQRGILRLASGHEREAEQALSQVIAACQSGGDVQALGHVEWVLAERDLVRGDPDGAQARLELALDHAGRLPFDAGLFSLRAWAELLAGDLVRAEATLSQALEMVEIVSDHPDRLFLVDAERIRALLLMRQRRWGEAERALEDALSQCRAMPYPYAEAKALYVMGLLHHAIGDQEQARITFEQSLAILNRLGERLYAEQVERALEGLNEA